MPVLEFNSGCGNKSLKCVSANESMDYSAWISVGWMYLPVPCNVLLWETWCSRKRAEQQAVKKRCLKKNKKIIKYVILLKYTKFFPIKEEEPQDQHNDLGCNMMFSIFELMCVPGAKAAQLCRSCCGCIRAVWLAGTERAESSLAAQLRTEGKSVWQDLKPLTPLLRMAGISTSSRKQLLGELPQDTPALQRAFRNQERTFTTYLCYCII